MKRIALVTALLLLWVFTGLAAQMLLTGVGSYVQASSYSGLITFVNTGACPAGTTEVSTFDGKTLFGTLNSHSDVGGTGGADSITATTASVTQPTISTPTIAWPAGVPTQASHTHTYTDVVNHTHTVTVTWNVQGGTTAATTGTHVMTSTATGGTARAPTSGDVTSATTANPAGGVSTGTTASATPVISWPAGVPTATTPTASGTAVTMNSFDNRSAYVKWIACKID